MSEAPQPRFTHDCTGCHFLGHHRAEEMDFDLYYCGQGGGLPTVVARFGNDGPEYLSGLNMTLTPALVEAQKRAKEKGLVA